MAARAATKPRPTRETYVRSRITNAEKEAATEVLNEMGLTLSDAIRLMLKQVVDKRALPFDVRVPNAKTVAALNDSRARKTTRYKSVSELNAELDNEDD